MPLCPGPAFSGIASSVSSPEPSDVFVSVKGTDSDGEEPSGTSFSSVPGDRDGQSFVEDGAERSSAGGSSKQPR